MKELTSGIYIANHVAVDYDQLNIIIVVASDMDNAINLLAEQADYGMESFLSTYTVEKIGVTDKPIGTLIARDY